MLLLYLLYFFMRINKTLQSLWIGQICYIFCLFRLNNLSYFRSTPFHHDYKQPPVRAQQTGTLPIFFHVLPSGWSAGGPRNLLSDPPSDPSDSFSLLHLSNLQSSSQVRNPPHELPQIQAGKRHSGRFEHDICLH